MHLGKRWWQQSLMITVWLWTLKIAHRKTEIAFVCYSNLAWNWFKYSAIHWPRFQWVIHTKKICRGTILSRNCRAIFLVKTMWIGREAFVETKRKPPCSSEYTLTLNLHQSLQEKTHSGRNCGLELKTLFIAEINFSSIAKFCISLYLWGMLREVCILREGWWRSDPLRSRNSRTSGDARHQLLQWDFKQGNESIIWYHMNHFPIVSFWFILRSCAASVTMRGAIRSCRVKVNYQSHRKLLPASSATRKSTCIVQNMRSPWIMPRAIICSYFWGST